MENETPSLIPSPSVIPTAPATVEWTSVKVYSLSAICLVLGIVLGALFHGPTQPAAVTTAAVQQMPAGMGNAAPTVAANDPAFERAKNEPNSFDALSLAEGERRSRRSHELSQRILPVRRS